MNPSTLDTRQLLAFRTLAETGGFTETAKRLHLTQSAISHSIRSLEDQLGSKLFDRIGKRAQLTEIGERLFTHTNIIFAEMDAALRSIEEVKTWGKGRIRIGATTSACQFILPAVLREFRECFPLCKIVVQPGDTPVLLEKLKRSEIDIAICLRPWKEIEFDVTLLFEDSLHAIVAPNHPIAKLPTIPQDNGDFPFIVYDSRSYTFDLVTHYFQEHKISQEHYIELGSNEAIKELAKIGLGIGILADWTLRKEVAEGSLKRIALGKNPLKRNWVLCRQKGHTRSLMENTFENLTRAVCDNLILEE